MNAKFLCFIMYATRYENFSLLKFHMKDIYVPYKELRGKKQSNKVHSRMMRTERQ
jgi:hypothetical protein